MTVLRPAQAADARVLAELHVATWRVAYRGLLPDDLLDALSVQDRERTWQQHLQEGVPVLLAEQDAEPVGFAAWGPSRDGDGGTDVGEVYALYVHPRAWARGAGRALQDAALTALIDAGCAEATLWILDENVRARAFYACHGWVPDGRVRTEQLAVATLTELRYRRPLRRLRPRA